MRTYVKPAIEIVNLKAAERIAGSCIMIGSCRDDDGNYIYSQAV